MALFENIKPSLSLDGVNQQLSYFYEQIHLLHHQTKSYAEHQALGSLYNKVVDFKDEIVEKLMGYTGSRPNSHKITNIVNYGNGVPQSVVKQLAEFAKQLEEWAEENEYCDIENIAQSLSGEAAKTLYLLTLS